MLSGLAAERIRLRIDNDVRRMRTVEQLRDPLVREGIRKVLRFDVRRVRIVARKSGIARRRYFFIDARQRSRILPLERILADLLYDPILVSPAARECPLEADHSTQRPHLVRAIAVRDREVRLRPDRLVGKQDPDRAIA